MGRTSNVHFPPIEIRTVSRRERDIQQSAHKVQKGELLLSGCFLVCAQGPAEVLHHAGCPNDSV